MTPGTALTNQVRAAASKFGARLFVQTVGKFWSGRAVLSHSGPPKTVTVTLQSGDVLLRGSRIVNVGAKGHPDLAGFTPIKITAEMVGTTLPLFTVIEIKAGKDRLRPEQDAALRYVRSIGGRAGVARSPEDAMKIVTGA